MTWVLRGLRNGVVTSRYPRHRDAYADSFPGAVTATGAPAPDSVAGICPTGAIDNDVGDGVVITDSRCIRCGECVRRYPEVFRWEAGSEPAAITATRAALAERVARLRRSVHIRHVDAGSDGTEEWEIHALTNPVYDVHRLGIFFTASPRHADILMVTGAGARGMLPALQRTRHGMPDPVVVIAVGTDAITGGLIGASDATVGGVRDVVPVDVVIPGSPPPPFAILHGILLALGRVPDRAPA